MFKSQNFCHIASNNRNNVKAGMFIYRTTDDLATVTANGYFNERIIDLNLHDIIVHEQIDNADPTKVKQNFLCVVQKTLTNVNTKIMDTDEVDGANTDLDNLSDTGKANISAEGTYDESATYADGTVGAAIKGRANTDLSNLTSTGANIGNWSSNVTNCIVEIPQDIKLELNNGTLTLKAGSKYYVPNGSGVFNIVNITADKTTTASANGVWIYFINESGNLQRWAVNECFSGTTAPTSVHYPMWYDTTNNAIKSSDDYGSTWSGKFSLPIAIVTVSSGQISSIDQVFNGFGYIGSTVFALPGISGLIPDGRNTDGTLNNKTSYNSTTVKIITPANGARYICLSPYSAYADVPLTTDFYYDETKNMNLRTSDGVQREYAVCGTFTQTDSGITNFTPKTAFHAVDYNDTDFIAHQAMPSSRYVNLTLPSNGGTITASADGYLTVNKSATATGQYINFINGSNGMNCNAIAPSALPLRLCMPVSKGDVITINYDADGTTTMFRFIYANGSK